MEQIWLILKTLISVGILASMFAAFKYSKNGEISKTILCTGLCIFLELAFISIG